MGSVELSPVQVTIYYLLLGIGMFLLFGYSYEYVRYRTLKAKPRRRFNQLFCGWLIVVGMYSWATISPILGIVFIGLGFLSYFLDKWLVDKMP